MVIKDEFFGAFLLNRGDVTQEALAKALERQRQSRIPIGQLALQKGWLIQKEVIRILTEQKNSPNGTGRFGQMAVRFKFLEENQVEQLLLDQRMSGDFIGEILVSQKALTKSEMIRALRKFHVSNK